MAFTLKTFSDSIHDEWLKDLHFSVGNEWVKGKGTPARTPFDYLIARSRLLHQKYGWTGTRLEVKDINA